MLSKIERVSPSPFVERSPLISLSALGLLFLALVVSPFLSRRLLQQGVSVPPSETVQLDPISPRPRPFGALRIDAVAQLPSNAWVTFEVQIYDTAGNLLASGIKQAWKESGTWQEEGESGTWSEGDAAGQFDIRQATLDGSLVIAVSSLEQGRVDGGELTDPVTFRVSVWEGAIDIRFLWVGTLGSLLLSGMAVLAVKQSGQTVISKWIADSDVSDRATMGGADTLVRIIVNVKADETCPNKLTATIAIRDSLGEVVYQQRVSLSMWRMRQQDDDIARGGCTLDVILEPPGSYGISVEVMPDASVDATTLTVKQGGRTLVPTEIIHIQSPGR